MAALTTIIAGAALAAGVAGQVRQVQAQKKAEKQTKRAAARQENLAREAAVLEKANKTADPKVKVGAEDTRKASTRKSGGTTGTVLGAATPSRVGGL